MYTFEGNYWCINMCETNITGNERFGLRRKRKNNPSAMDKCGQSRVGSKEVGRTDYRLVVMILEPACRQGTVG